MVEKRGVAGTVSKGVLIVKFDEDDEEMFEDEGKGADVSPFKGGIGVSADEFDATISAPFCAVLLIDRRASSMSGRKNRIRSRVRTARRASSSSATMRAD